MNACRKIAALALCAVLLMPCDIGRLPLIAQEDPASWQTIQEVLEDSAQWLSGTSGEALLREALDRSADFRLESAAEALAQKPFLLYRRRLCQQVPRQCKGELSA